MSDVPTNITREHLLNAIKKIDDEGVEKGAQSSTYDLLFKGKKYPPKLVVSWANEFANGEVLERQAFQGGLKSACFKVIKSAGFEIIEKKSSILKIVDQFIRDTAEGSQKTKHYPKNYEKLTMKVSFGQGALAKVPWIAFLKNGEEVQKGIYPVLLMYKELNCLVLAYGISEKNSPKSSWNISNKQTTKEYFKQVYDHTIDTYTKSFVCGVYKIDKPLDAKRLASDMTKILNDYENANFEEISEHLQASVQSSKTYSTAKPKLNQILYGPPGTGKTYHTIEAAVRAVEPNKVWEDRNELKVIYDKLVEVKRIRFITFHQSYGYEEFVEGISADTDDDNGITYKKRDGIFKKICRDASNATIEVNEAFDLNGKVWKLSIGGAQKNQAKEYCINNNLGAIGWSDTGDLNLVEENTYHLSLGKNEKNSLEYFSKTAEIGELVLCINSKTSVEAVGVIIGEYEFSKAGVPSRDDFCHHLPIKWLAKGINVDFKSLNDNTSFGLSTFYPLKRLTIPKVLEHLANNDIEIANYKHKTSESVDNYVLIIDEINRGNISKIFGDLITLIEPSKRLGNSEAIKLSLPMTGEEFGVPNNVHIIGTMNTADRSLALMDTALRRRFDFVEMMANYDVLKDENGNDYLIKVDGNKINVYKLLMKLNQRIEALYDREHTIGHAFLISVIDKIKQGDDKQALNELVNCFKNKVIPLLVEYFYEDWQKIRLILGDNQKPSKLQFIKEVKIDFTQLFGKAYESDDYNDEEISYQLAPFDDDLWSSAKSYIRIYEPKLMNE